MASFVCCPISSLLMLFFFNDTATTEIYTLSLHDALPIYLPFEAREQVLEYLTSDAVTSLPEDERLRSEEHTSELQSPCNLVCRLLLEKKKHAPAPPQPAARRGGDAADMSLDRGLRRLCG